MLSHILDIVDVDNAESDVAVVDITLVRELTVINPVPVYCTTGEGAIVTCNAVPFTVPIVDVLPHDNVGFEFDTVTLDDAGAYKYVVEPLYDIVAICVPDDNIGDTFGAYKYDVVVPTCNVPICIPDVNVGVKFGAYKVFVVLPTFTVPIALPDVNDGVHTTDGAYKIVDVLPTFNVPNSVDVAYDNDVVNDTVGAYKYDPEPAYENSAIGVPDVNVGTKYDDAGAYKVVDVLPTFNVPICVPDE